MAKLESLVVDLQLKSAELQKGLDQATKKLDDFGKKVDGISKTVNLSAVASMAKQATTALVNFVRHGAEVADTTGKMAAAAGISVESFSKLQYAAQLGGVGAEEFSAAMAKLNKNISLAATGGKQQQALFSSLGVSVKDAAGNVKSADVVFAELADAFDQMAPGASKAKLEMDLLGKTGAKFESVFAGGSAGLRELGDEADRLGITISGKTAAAAQEFNDNAERMELALSRVGAQVAGEVAPAFSKLTDFLLKSKEGADLLKGAVTVLSNLMKVLATVAIAVGTAFDVVGTVLGQGAAQLYDILTGNFKGALEGGKGLNEDIKKKLATAGKLIEATWTEGSEAAEKGAKKIVKSGDAVAQNADDTAKALQEQETALKNLEKMAIDYETKLAQFGKGPLEELQASFDGGKLGAEFEKAGAKGQQFKDRIIAAAGALEELERQQISMQLGFEAETSNRSAGRNRDQLRTDFSNIGKSDRDVAAGATKGFASFEDALQRAAKMTVKSNELIAEAKLAERDKLYEEADRLTQLAEKAQEGADNATKAAAGFKTVAEIDFEASRAKIEETLSGLASIGLQFAGELGDLGDVINAGVKGAEAGGVWGAIIAVIIEMLSKFERFGEVMDIASGALEFALTNMADGFNSLIDGIRPLMGAFSMIAKAIHTILGPILAIVGKLFQQIAATLVPVGIIMQHIGASLSPLFTIISAIIDILKIFQPILALVSLAMLGLKLGIQYVTLGFNEFLDWILEKVGGNNNSGVESAQRAVNTTRGEIDALWKQLQKDPFNAVTNFANDAADSLEDLGIAAREEEKATKDTTDSLNRLSASFTNAPQGFKYNWRSYQAQDAVDTGMAQLAGTGGTSVYVAGSIVTQNELHKEVEKYTTRRKFQKGG